MGRFIKQTFTIQPIKLKNLKTEGKF